jgi:hypothetical protein
VGEGRLLELPSAPEYVIPIHWDGNSSKCQVLRASGRRRVGVTLEARPAEHHQTPAQGKGNPLQTELQVV